MVNIFKIAEEEKAKGLQTAICTIVSTQGSTPLKTGAKMLVTQYGKIHGTIGGGNFEKKVIEDAMSAMAINESKLFQHHLLQEHGMCCGGTVNVFIESIMPPEKLIIFGAGHVGRALSEYASSLSFDVYVIDDRQDEIEKIQNTSVNKIKSHYSDFLPGLSFNKQTYIAIMTYDHRMDREILSFCIQKPLAYLGMIGSERKVAVTRKMFLSSSLCDEKDLEKVDMPMGFDIMGTGPQEIAISILAKIIEVKNKRNKNKKTESKKKSISESNPSIAECIF